MKYKLELSEEQVEIIKIALEEYFRLRMNQTWDFADSLCFEDLKKTTQTKNSISASRTETCSGMNWKNF